MQSRKYCRYCGEPIDKEEGEVLKPKTARTVYYHWDCAKKVEQEWKKLNEEKEILQYKAPAKN